MAKITVREATSASDIKKFIRFPWKIYSKDSFWVPPLLAERKLFFNSRKNPFYRHSDVALWLAERDGEVVGTISSHVDHNFVEFQQEQTGQFGFFECIDDPEVAAALLGRAEDYLREKKMERAIGPFNFTTNHECGLLVDGFDGTPVIMMTYNPRYYEKLITDAGYEKAMDLFAYSMDTKSIPPGLESFAEKFLSSDSGITIRKMDFSQIEREIKNGRIVYNQAWSKNWGAVPLTDEEFALVIRELKPILDPDLCFFALKGEEPIGFALSLPDVNPVVKTLNGKLFPFGWYKLLQAKKHYKYIRVLVLGVLQEYHQLGIGGVFYYLTWKEAISKGVQGAEMSWILENNKPMRRALEMMGAEIYRTYRIYGKSL
jgi:GNAT superfamily N-acetyltransferase